MSLIARIALGLMTVWAVLYAFAALDMDLGLAQIGFAWFGPEIQAVSIIDVLVIFGAYTYLALRSPRMQAMDRVGWICAMLFLYPFVVPLFWYLHVWRVPLPLPSPGNAGRKQ